MLRAEVARRLDGVPAVALGGALVAVQLAVAAALAADGDWSFSAAEWIAGCVLLAAVAGLLYGVGRRLGGPLLGIGVTLLWIVAPVILIARYWRVGGNPPIDFADVYQAQVLPTAFGLEAVEPLAAGCLLLASGWLVLARRGLPLAAGTAAGAAAGAAVLVQPRAWPALAAPVLALAWSRRPGPAAGAAAAALLALAALALFRDVPGTAIDFHHMGTNLSAVREFSWSARLLEYLPLAGAIGLAIRRPAAGVFFGWLLLTVILLPLARPIGLAELLVALVPGLPVYALLTASIPFLVPRGHAATAPARVELS